MNGKPLGEARQARLSVLFVHGMGRSPVSGWPMLHQLKRAGLHPSSFAYSTTFERFTAITARLLARITKLANQGDYVLIGHSLGGVLLRAALQELPPHTPLPHHLFLLASPVNSARLACSLARNPVFRLATGDCGQWLASDSAMASIGSPPLPTTSIAGTRGFNSPRSPFGQEINDGVVSLSEVSAPWLTDQILVDNIHTLLPASPGVARIILEKLEKAADSRPPQ